jgi:hypothetical protein
MRRIMEASRRIYLIEIVALSLRLPCSIPTYIFLRILGGIESDALCREASQSGFVT